MNMTFDPPARALFYTCSAMSTFGILQICYLGFCMWQDAAKERRWKAAFSLFNISLLAMSVSLAANYMFDAVEYYTCNLTWCDSLLYEEAIMFQIIPATIYKVSYCIYSYSRCATILEYVFTIYAKFIRYFIYMTVAFCVISSAATFASMAIEMNNLIQLNDASFISEVINMMVSIVAPASEIMVLTMDIVFLAAFGKMAFQTRATEAAPIDPRLRIISIYGIWAVCFGLLSLGTYIYYLADGYYVDSYGYVYMAGEFLGGLQLLALFAMKLALRRVGQRSKSKIVSRLLRGVVVLVSIIFICRVVVVLCLSKNINAETPLAEYICEWLHR